MDRREERREEIIMFLQICGEEDRRFMERPEEERTAEDYVRLMQISKALECKHVFMRLAIEASKRTEEILEYGRAVEGNKEKLREWFEAFIAAVPIPACRARVREELEKALENWD